MDKIKLLSFQLSCFLVFVTMASLDKEEKKQESKIINGVSGIRNNYSLMGVENYYIKHGDNYRNPHEIKITNALNKLLFNKQNEWIKQINFEYILDLCCGSGEITMYLKQYLLKNKINNYKIDGIDPFTYNAYLKRTGITAYKYNFKDIQNGILWKILENNDDNNNYYSLIVCSYALHLCKISQLSSVCYCLSMVGHKLLIITPHKRPIIDEKMGWKLLFEGVNDKVRIRLYQSIYFMNNK